MGYFSKKELVIKFIFFFKQYRMRVNIRSYDDHMNIL